MSMWTYGTPPKYYQTAVANTQGWATPSGELLVSIQGMATAHADAIAVPTFTLAVPANATYTTGQVLTFTLTVSEPIQIVNGTPSLILVFTSGQVSATYNATASTSTSLVFNYTVLATDASAAGITVDGIISLTSGAYILDLITGTCGQPVAPASLVFTPPVTTGIIIN